MDLNLSRLCKTEEQAELWRINLAMMEMRERRFGSGRYGSRYET